MALYYKRLSGAEVAKIFETYGVYGYITKYFEQLHTMGDRYIVQDIDDYISGLVMQVGIDTNARQYDLEEKGIWQRQKTVKI